MGGGRRGFTVIELLVVLTFLGLGAAVAVPAFRNPGERGVGAASRALMAAWAEARGEAARRAEPVTVTLE
ncbi:MAG TPA: prepilin-type N-terminal cleavage/methylation domain-containing protein, partial [Longimicrobiaceae bacterium]|nr:prepilin-type N-terminal cleavage/methylation domain-containing protein [Longimicrobiaceae bacterium]